MIFFSKILCCIKTKKLCHVHKWIMYNVHCFRCNHCNRHRRHGTIDDMLKTLSQQQHPSPAKWTNGYCDECFEHQEKIYSK